MSRAASRVLGTLRVPPLNMEMDFMGCPGRVLRPERVMQISLEQFEWELPIRNVPM